MTNSDIDLLRALFGSYYHEDWDAEFHSDEDLIQAFSAEVGRSTVIGTEAALRRAIGSMRSDDDAERMLREWHSKCVPQGPTDPPRLWLEKLADLLRHQSGRDRLNVVSD